MNVNDIKKGKRNRLETWTELLTEATELDLQELRKKNSKLFEYICFIRL